MEQVEEEIGSLYKVTVFEPFKEVKGFNNSHDLEEWIKNQKETHKIFRFSTKRKWITRNKKTGFINIHDHSNCCGRFNLEINRKSRDIFIQQLLRKYSNLRHPISGEKFISDDLSLSLDMINRSTTGLKPTFHDSDASIVKINLESRYKTTNIHRTKGFVISDKDFFDFKETEEILLDEWKKDTPEWMSEEMRERVSKMTKWRKSHAFGVPSQDALIEIARYVKGEKVLSVASGNGYWEYLLKSIGVDIIATDPGIGGYGEYWTRTYTKVEKMDALEAIKNHEQRNVLFICWPLARGTMAFDALACFKGSYCVYIGEKKGGMTATWEFFEEVDENWDIEKRVKLPSWPSLADKNLPVNKVWLMKRKEITQKTERERIINHVIKIRNKDREDEKIEREKESERRIREASMSFEFIDAWSNIEDIMTTKDTKQDVSMEEVD
jgi:hypothetical protein